MKSYTVRTSCEIAGTWREKGEVVDLSDDQARELAPPFGSSVLLKDEKEDSADAKLDGNKRDHGKAAN